MPYPSDNLSFDLALTFRNTEIIQIYCDGCSTQMNLRSAEIINNNRDYSRELVLRGTAINSTNFELKPYYPNYIIMNGKIFPCIIKSLDISRLPSIYLSIVFDNLRYLKTGTLLGAISIVEPFYPEEEKIISKDDIWGWIEV